MKIIIFLLAPMVALCQNEAIIWKSGVNEITVPSYRPFISENFIEAIDDYSNYIALNQSCYHKIPIIDSSYSFQLRAPFCCSSIQLLDTAYSKRGEVYYFLGMYGRALADFNMACELDPTSGYFHNARGYLYLIQGDYEKAISDFSGVIKNSPEYFYSYVLRAEAYFLIEQYERCIEDLNIVISNKNDNVYDLHINRADCYVLEGYFKRAMSDYKKAIRLEPNNPLGYYRKGVLLEVMGLDSCDEYQKSCELGYDQGCEFYTTTKWFCE